MCLSGAQSLHLKQQWNSKIIGMEHLHGSRMFPELNEEAHRTLVNISSMERSEMEEVNSGIVATILIYRESEEIQE